MLQSVTMAEQRYLVTARKYRPQRFDQLVAQDHVAKTLRNALRLDRLAHAYLFSGPRGVGKTTAARILAKSINCESRGEDCEPCCQCPSCGDFEQQRSLNIFEIDAASNNKVDDVRELRESVRIPPQHGTKKVYIIDEVHMLSNAAFNALLKTLEEPPPHVLFIFATTEPHKVLPTILSRCQRFDFRRIPVQAIVKHLRAICKVEDVTSDDDSLLLLAHKGDGALRDALSAFDQAVALCGQELVYSELAAALRVVDVDLYFEVTRCIAQRDSAGLLGLAGRCMEEGYDVREFIHGLSEHIRNLLVVVTLGKHATLDVSRAVLGRYAASAPSFSEITLLRLLMVLDDAESRIATSTSPRLLMELTLAKMGRMGDASDLRRALKQVSRLTQAASRAQPAVQTQRPHAPAPAQAAPSSPPPASAPLQPAAQPQPASAPSTGPTPESPQNLPAPSGPSRAMRETGSQVFGTPALAKPARPHAADPPGVDLNASWTQFQSSVLQMDPQRGPALIAKCRLLDVDANVVRIAVRDTGAEIRIQTLQEPLQQALESAPALKGRTIHVTVRPDLFPTPKTTGSAQRLEELCQEHPTFKALHEGFDLVPLTP